VGGGELRVALALSNHCERKSEEGSGRCARRRRIDWYQRGAAQYLKVVGIELALRQYCGSPTKDSGSLAAQSVWKQREEGEEREGFL
jgi:hypothetical protein